MNKFYLNSIDKLLAFEDIQKDEVFKEIKNTNYYISNQGRVLSVCGRTARILKQETIKGYKYINLNKKKYRVHRLVAKYFVPNNDILKNIVHHIDGNKQNNNYNNLQWTTIRQNTIEYYKRKKANEKK